MVVCKSVTVTYRMRSFRQVYKMSWFKVMLLISNVYKILLVNVCTEFIAEIDELLMKNSTISGEVLINIAEHSLLL